MATIKIRGINEPITVSDDEARKLKERKQRGEISSDEDVQVGMYYGKLSNIVAIIVGKETTNAGEEHKQRLRKYYAERDVFLRLSPKEKAEKRAWGSFSMLYFAVHGKNPPNELKSKVRTITEKFYEKNPEWSCPRVSIWRECDELKSGLIAGDYNAAAIRILERGEEQELKDIASNREYNARFVDVLAEEKQALHKKIPFEEVPLPETEQQAFDRESYRESGL